MSIKKEVLRTLATGSLLLAGCKAQAKSPEIAKHSYELKVNSFEVAKADFLAEIEATELKQEPNSFLLREFRGEEGEFIRQIEQEFGILIDSPFGWVLEGKQVYNLAWSRQELDALSQALRGLPPFYRQEDVTPNELILLKMIGNFEDYEGGYSINLIQLSLPEDFGLQARPAAPLGAYLESGSKLIRFILLHEWTHKVAEVHPEVLEDWKLATDWYLNDAGQWIKHRPWEIFPYGNAGNDPNEDFANSVALMAVRPEVLTPDRIEFFRSNEFFKDWFAVQNRQEHLNAKK